MRAIGRPVFRTRENTAPAKTLARKKSHLSADSREPKPSSRNVWGYTGVRIQRAFQKVVKPGTSKSLDEAKLRTGSGETFFDFGQGENPIPPPAILFERLHHHELSKRGYPEAKGVPAVCNEIARYEREEHKIDRDGDHILIGSGGRSLLHPVFQVTDHSVVCPTPSWVTYWQYGIAYSRRFVPLHLSRDNYFQMDMERLEGLIKGKIPPQNRFLYRLSTFRRLAPLFGNPFHESPLVVFTHPENPQGGRMSRFDLQRFAELGRMYDLMVLADEIYDELTFDKSFVSLASLYPKVIRLAGLSKCWGMAGYRFCWLSIPDDLMDLKTKLLRDYPGNFSGGTSHPLQYAVADVLRDHRDVLKEHFAHNRRILHRVGQYAYSLMKEAAQSLPNGLIIGTPPMAGLYKWMVIIGELEDRLRKNGIQTSAQLTTYLSHKFGVGVLPGVNFGRPAEELSFRIVFAKGLDDGVRALDESQQIGFAPGADLPDDFVTRQAQTLTRGLARLFEGIRTAAT